MGINKVKLGDEVLIDITDSTVTPEKLKKGETAYNASGEKIIGTMVKGSDLEASHTIINDITGTIRTETADEVVETVFNSDNGVDTIIETHIPYSGSVNYVKTTVITPTDTGDDILTTVTEVNKQ